MNPLLVALSVLWLAAWSPVEYIQYAQETNVVLNESCSGTVIGKDKGLISTAFHCITSSQRQRSIKKEMYDGSFKTIVRRYYIPLSVAQYKSNEYGELYSEVKLTAEVIGFDEANDIAILRITNKGIFFTQEATLSNTLVKYADRVYTIGNPYMIYNTVSEGRVTKPRLNRFLSSGIPVNAIVFDAYMNKGSSGGALYNDNGELIGITNWGLPGGPYLASPVFNLKKLLAELGY